MDQVLGPVGGLAASLLLLVLGGRLFHRTLSRLLVGVLRGGKLALTVYALLLLPGAALHEFSHWLVAKALRVPTHGFSLLPSEGEDGWLRLGYVETSKVDFLRTAAIGMAPLLVGTGVVSWLALRHLPLLDVWGAMVELDGEGLLRAVRETLMMPDLALWIYLLLAVGNTMLPSASDRSTWVPAFLFLVLAAGMLAVLGFDSLISPIRSEGAVALVNAVSAAFMVVFLLDMLALLPMWLLLRLMGV